MQKEKYFNAKENRNVAVHILGIKGSFVTKINELFELQNYDQNLIMNWKYHNHYSRTKRFSPTVKNCKTQKYQCLCVWEKLRHWKS